MYLQADHLFYQKFNSDMDVVIEQLTQHVQAVNDIYRSVGESVYSVPKNAPFWFCNNFVKPSFLK